MPTLYKHGFHLVLAHVCPTSQPCALRRPGAVLTKMDGDSRGGAALSVHEVSGKPIKFVGTGERLEALEPFYPDRLAGRILGMGADESHTSVRKLVDNLRCLLPCSAER